jgi:hypothetical protein
MREPAKGHSFIFVRLSARHIQKHSFSFILDAKNPLLLKLLMPITSCSCRCQGPVLDARKQLLLTMLKLLKFIFYSRCQEPVLEVVCSGWGGCGECTLFVLFSTSLNPQLPHLGLNLG